MDISYFQFAVTIIQWSLCAKSETQKLSVIITLNFWA